MQLFVGVTALVGRIERYAERFDLFELRLEPGRPLAPKSLKKLRAQAGKDLIFSLLLPPALSATLLSTPASADAVIESASALDARWIVIQTGPEIGPSARVRARLGALAERLADGARRLAWEPRGPWEPETARELAESLGLRLVEDLSMVDHAPEDVVYTRLRVQGPGAQLRSSALARLAEQVDEVEELFVVIEGRGSPRARSRIEQALGLALDARTAEDEDEEDGEEDAVRHDSRSIVIDSGNEDSDLEDDESDDDEAPDDDESDADDESDDEEESDDDDDEDRR